MINPIVITIILFQWPLSFTSNLNANGDLIIATDPRQDKKMCICNFHTFAFVAALVSSIDNKKYSQIKN